MMSNPGEEEQRYCRMAGLCDGGHFIGCLQGQSGWHGTGAVRGCYISASQKVQFHKQVKKDFFFLSFCGTKRGLSTFYSVNLLINKNQISTYHLPPFIRGKIYNQYNRKNTILDSPSKWINLACKEDLASGDQHFKWQYTLNEWG